MLRGCSLEDTYFYWVHRLLHTKFLFKKVHFLHHQNTNPTIFTALYLHPLEALSFPFWMLIMPFVLPVHPLALVIVATFTIFYDCYLHLGYEVIPNSKIKNILKKYIYTATSHNMHHKNSRQNFGYYTNFWDRLMGTQSAEGLETFDKLTKEDLIGKDTKAKISQKLSQTLQINCFKRQPASFTKHSLHCYYNLSYLTYQAKFLLKRPIDIYTNYKKTK